jgi:hypothetical protein
MLSNVNNDNVIAIVIPYYKLTFFEETLDSLANQTDKRFKVYIGDDNSKDSPLSLLSNYESRIDYDYFKFEENLGSISLVKQWDRCIAKIHDERWIMLLCDDDYISPNHIEEFYKNIQEVEELNIKVIRYASCVDEDESNIQEVFTHPKIENATDFFFRRIKNKTRSSLSEYIFKNDTYKKHGFYNYPLAWHSDDRAWLEFSDFRKILTINTSCVVFRLSAENISRVGYKTIEKEKAKLEFYNFIVFKHIFKFKRSQRLEILFRYEQFIYKINKVNFKFFVNLIILLIINLYFVTAIKFTRRVLIYLRNNV